MINSTSNPQIKLIRKLKDRKYRAESNFFFLEGVRIVIEALNAGEWITQLIVSRDLIGSAKAVEVVEEAECKGVAIMEVSKEVFESISGKDGPQGVAAVAQQKWTELDLNTPPLPGIWIALYQIADPGNLGTILRTLDGMGGEGVILLDHCTDPFDPSAIRASMGSVFSKKIIKSTSQTFMDWVKKNNILVTGTADSAKTDYRQYQYPKNGILLMGSEREGLPEALAAICNDVVSIPMAGNADSLNLAVASSIVLYEIAWQHKE
ncbi:MAG: RNA methyltransferase [Chloroflexi bacterium HGW-Chloroflexi-4]|nr:MAG: RNA methyltransferase [Chloroflexi bacterium HGW-Chloroflexi-4]